MKQSKDYWEKIEREKIDLALEREKFRAALKKLKDKGKLPERPVFKH